MGWDIHFLPAVQVWFDQLLDADPESAHQITAALNHLERSGPSLGRPLVDTLTGSAFTNLKELRPGSSGRNKIRILFVFDPSRTAVLLTAGNKAGNWRKWYRENIPLAENRYAHYLEEYHNQKGPTQ